MEPQQPDRILAADRRVDETVARFTREVVLSGRHAEAAGTELQALLAESGARPLLVDFGNVRGLTSIMLGKLIALNRAAESNGGRLGLFNLAPDVRAILDVTRLNLILRLYDDETDALQGPRPAGE
jgi:anti-anti-sigma factor